jgi:cyclin-A
VSLGGLVLTPFTHRHSLCVCVQRQFRPKPEYMRRQRDITNSMRTILVDWLVEVAEEYRLSTGTLFTAVSYIDRFLSEMSVQRGKLQLVGVTCMLLAAKYEEIYPPGLEEFVYITDNTYSREQVCMCAWMRVCKTDGLERVSE